MAWHGLLEVEQYNYIVLYVSLEVHQTIDEVGRPNSPVQGCNVYLELDLGNDVVEKEGHTFLLAWATAPNKQYDCIVTEIGQENVVFKKIKLQQACCVDYIEKYSDGSGLSANDLRTTRGQLQNHVLCLRLTTPKLTVEDVELQNF
jgi:Hemolysin coregulated protein Hcp (TssD)